MNGIYWHNGEWSTDRKMVAGHGTHSLWMGNTVFDGARTFMGCTPDLDRHCKRAIRSAETMMLRPKLTATELAAICQEGISQFASDEALYIKPVFFAQDGFLAPDPDSTDCIIEILPIPMPEFTGFSAVISPFRRPSPDMAPTGAKASCLYPNSQRSVRYAQERGFDNAVTLNPNGSVAEFTSANIMIVKNGVVRTPIPTGSFLAGITRARVMALLRDAHLTVEECTLSVNDLFDADEIFSVGNFAKVLPLTNLCGTDFEIGSVAQKARALYWDYAREAHKGAINNA